MRLDVPAGKKDLEEPLNGLEQANLKPEGMQDVETAASVRDKEVTRKSKFMMFIDGNLIKGTERRLTIPNKKRHLDSRKNNDRWALSKENMRRLKNGYRHPFERIPEGFFTGVSDHKGHHNKRLSDVQNLLTEPVYKET